MEVGQEAIWRQAHLTVSGGLYGHRSNNVGCHHSDSHCDCRWTDVMEYETKEETLIP